MQVALSLFSALFSSGFCGEQSVFLPQGAQSLAQGAQRWSELEWCSTTFKLPRRITVTLPLYSAIHEIPHCVRNDEWEFSHNDRGGQCRQAMQTRWCGFSRYARNRPADLTFLLLFWSSKKVKEEINMNGRLYDPVIARFFSPDKYVANSSFTQDFNRYSYARNNPLMYTDPSGEFIFFFPTFNWSAEGGFGIGLTFGVGIPGIINANINIGYNITQNDFSVGIGVTAAMNTIYASYSTQNGFSVGWTAGLTSYAGFPISSNIATVGVNYNISNQSLSCNISAAQWQQDRGWSFNPSLSVAVAPEQFTNLVKGQGFRSNSEVFDRMMSGDALRKGDQFTCQQILKYFGFKGTYNPNHEAWEKYGVSPAMIHPKTGEILYHDYPFQGNYDRLALTAHHELIHQRDFRIGHKYNMMEVFQDEWSTYMTNYKNQGLYPNHGIDLVNRINYYGYGVGIYGETFFTPAWWHFIYRIPRLW